LAVKHMALAELHGPECVPAGSVAQRCTCLDCVDGWRGGRCTIAG